MRFSQLPSRLWISLRMLVSLITALIFANCAKRHMLRRENSLLLRPE